MWGNLSKLNLCTYHPVHCQALYTALRGTSTVLRQLSAAPELPLDEHLVTRFHIGIAPKKSFFRDSGSVWDFFLCDFCSLYLPSFSVWRITLQRSDLQTSPLFDFLMLQSEEKLTPWVLSCFVSIWLIILQQGKRSCLPMLRENWRESFKRCDLDTAFILNQ